MLRMRKLYNTQAMEEEIILIIRFADDIFHRRNIWHSRALTWTNFNIIEGTLIGRIIAFCQRPEFYVYI